MSRKHILLLSICALFGILTIGVLYSVSNTMIHRRNNFLRVFPPHPIIEDTVLDIQYNSYYLAGADKKQIFLGNSVAPFHLLIVNKELTDTQHVRLNIRDMNILKFRSLQLKINSPYFYMLDGTLPGIFRGRIDEWLADRFMCDSSYFSLAELIGHSSVALRASNKLTREDILGKEMQDNMQYFPGLLEKQIDGVFDVDGTLQYDKDENLVVYVYYYRNQYIVMDTSLNLINRGRTIDTVTHAQIKVDSIIKKDSYTYTMSAPPLVINKMSCVYKGLLFINSNQLAKNEDIEAFNQSSVIDVYDLTNYQYQFSFYVPHYNSNKMKEFKFYDNKFFARFDHYILSYDLNENVFIKRISQSF